MGDDLRGSTALPTHLDTHGFSLAPAQAEAKSRPECRVANGHHTPALFHSALSAPCRSACGSWLGPVSERLPARAPFRDAAWLEHRRVCMNSVLPGPPVVLMLRTGIACPPQPTENEVGGMSHWRWRVDRIGWLPIPTQPAQGTCAPTILSTRESIGKMQYDHKKTVDVPWYGCFVIRAILKVLSARKVVRDSTIETRRDA
jgi:hypothetical protein